MRALATIMVGAGLLAGAPAQAAVTLLHEAGGADVATWLERFWQKLGQIPVSRNPLEDTDGSRQPSLQGSPGAYVVAGVGVGVTGIVRHFAVPRATPLFIPLINGSAVETDPAQQFFPILRQIIDDTPSLFLTIDGAAVTQAKLLGSRAQSPRPFSIDIIPDSSIVGEQAGTWPARVDGYAVLLAGLDPGVHRLDFGGTFDLHSVGGGLQPTGLTTFVRVTPLPAGPWLLASGLAALGGLARAWQGRRGAPLSP